MLCAEEARKLRLDFSRRGRVCPAKRRRGMDEEATDLIRGLCTEIGAIMEDESVAAIVWMDAEQVTVLERLERLEEAGKAISTLAAAAKVLMLP